MKRVIIIMFCAVLIPLVYLGCGTDSADTIYICSVTTEYWDIGEGPIPADLMGSYTLTGFDIEYYTVFGNYIKTHTESDFTVAEGSMTIDNLYVDQVFSMSGSAHLTGNWYIFLMDSAYQYLNGGATWADSTSGTISLDGWETPFVTMGDVLSITYPMGCFLLEETEVPEEPEEPEEPVQAEDSMLSDTDMVIPYKNRMFYPVLR